MIRPQSANASSIREHNLSLVLDQIRLAGTISRAEIIRNTSLSPTAVSALVSILVNSGFVRETGVGQSSGGRRPILLEFDYQHRYAIGADLGASHISVVATDLRGNIVAHETRRWNVINDPEGSIQLLNTMIAEVLHSPAISVDEVLGIGLTVPTPLEGKNLDQMLTYYMPTWEGVRLFESVQERFGLPVYIENDANAGAIAEKLWGLGRAVNSLAFIKLGIGVGSGIVIDDKIYRGFSGAAGEIGHTTIEASGRKCRCGNQGCMESYVGAAGVVADVKDGFNQAKRAIVDTYPRTVAEVVSAALSGDEVCRAVISNAGKYLGVAVANLLNLVNPGLVILGGEITKAGSLLTDAVEATVNERALPIPAIRAPIVISQLGEHVVALGAATIAILNAFQPNYLAYTLGLQERR